MHRLLGLSDMKANTQWAPLALLGYRLQQRQFFDPLDQQLDLKQKKMCYTSKDKIITCLVSMMSGCQAICHINTRIRPDRALAQAWGLECFAEQSSVANTLNHLMRDIVEIVWMIFSPSRPLSNPVYPPDTGFITSRAPPPSATK